MKLGARGSLQRDADQLREHHKGSIGLQNGDTIKVINGSEMTTVDAALMLYIKLRNASHLSVQVEMAVIGRCRRV